MAINKELAMTISFEIGIITISTIASFILPGLGGLLVSGLIQLLGDVGLELAGEGMPSNPAWYITEFLAVLGPYFQEFKSAKINSTLLRTSEKSLLKLERGLEKIDNAGIEAIEWLKKQSSNFFNKESGYTQTIENEIREVEAQEAAREKLGTDKVKVKKRLESFAPNTKNPMSWIAGVGFKETMRLGPRDIRGDLIITYYENNQHRVGFVNKPIGKIVLGRTSGGEKVGSNKARYRKQYIQVDPSKVKLKKVVFKGARYYGDYLAFLKAGSWGGYYMRRWMIGVPGRKAGINSLILFGSVWRVWSKVKSLADQTKLSVTDASAFARQYGTKTFGQTRLGSRANQITGYFAKGQSIRESPFREAVSESRQKLEARREDIRNNNLHKRR